jgi:hypothetical protein
MANMPRVTHQTVSGHEWEKAVLNPVHAGRSPETIAAVKGKIVRIAVTEARNPSTCDGRCFLIHPDDVRRLMPWKESGVATICEHEVVFE